MSAIMSRVSPNAIRQFVVTVVSLSWPSDRQ